MSNQPKQVLLIYAFTAVSILQEVFSLITKLPDEILKWIGAVS